MENGKFDIKQGVPHGFDYPDITCEKCGHDNKGNDPTRIAKFTQGDNILYNCRCGNTWHGMNETPRIAGAAENPVIMTRFLSTPNNVVPSETMEKLKKERDLKLVMTNLIDKLSVKDYKCDFCKDSGFIHEPGVESILPIRCMHCKRKIWNDFSSIVIPHVTVKNSNITFQIQDGPSKEVGKNGCDVDDIGVAWLAILKIMNTKFSCAENGMAMQKIKEALELLKRRKMDREERGVEGFDRR